MNDRYIALSRCCDSCGGDVEMLGIFPTVDAAKEAPDTGGFCTQRIVVDTEEVEISYDSNDL